MDVVMNKIECDICNNVLGYFHSPEKVEAWLTTELWEGGMSPHELIDMIGVCMADLDSVHQLTAPRASRTAA